MLVNYIDTLASNIREEKLQKRSKLSNSIDVIKIAENIL